MSEERRELAWKAHREGDLLRAEREYRALLASCPEDGDVVNLGALLRHQGRLHEAAGLYERWLPHFADGLQLHLNAANCLYDLSQHDACVALLRGYLQRHPHAAKAQWALARSLSELRHYGEAETLLRQLTQGNGHDLPSWMELGVCLHRQEKQQEALGCFERVNQLDPNHAVAAANRITILKDAGQFEQCQRLIAELPSPVRADPMVRGAIATMHMAANAMESAVQELVPLCSAEPNQGGHWLNLAACLRTLKHCNAALTVLKRGICRQPTNTDLQQALGQCLAELGRTDQALPVLRRSAGEMASIKDEHLFNIQFLGAGYHLIPPAELQAWAQAWEARLQRERNMGPLWPDVIREAPAQRRLRVGYLSADWSNHPVCRFMLPVLQHHNREAVEIWGLCSSPHHDNLHAQAQRLCDHWLDLRHATDLEAARVISDLQLDVLVELGGYTGHSRIAVLLHRPAPVQLSYLGYFAPTYLKAVDGWIGDAALFAGLDAVDQLAQRLWEVEGGYMAYQPPADLPEPKRQEGERFRFGSFNHSRKLNAGSVALYARVLEAVPNSELVLKSISFVEPSERERVRAALEAAGVDRVRVRLLDATDDASDHIACYGWMDVALDPFPYGGATTSCEALVMGVPVVTLAGAGMVGRLSSSILSSAGLADWIALNEEEYVAIAVALAGDGVRRKKKRLKLRQKVLQSHLCDGRRLCRELEQIYRDVCAMSAVE